MKVSYAKGFIIISIVFALDCLLCNLSAIVYPGKALDQDYYNLQSDLYNFGKDMVCVFPYILLFMWATIKVKFDFIDIALAILCIFISILNPIEDVIDHNQMPVKDEWLIFSLVYLFLLTFKIAKVKKLMRPKA